MQPRSPTLNLITKTMRVSDIAALCPGAADVLGEYGLHCAGCSYNGMETLEEGCHLHGFEDAEIAELVDDLNILLREQPARPPTLTVTAAAARAVLSVMEEEKRVQEGLAVILDDGGGFCMEFRKDALPDETTFQNAEVPEVRVFASELTLGRIGGSTIDFREGRFKLDLPADDAANRACACGGSCSCGKKETAGAD
jgi:hybrid cluster-associated redox disulfide protein